jgi:hypothetical protein
MHSPPKFLNLLCIAVLASIPSHTTGVAVRDSIAIVRGDACVSG